MTDRLRRRIERDFPAPGSAKEIVGIVSAASDSERIQAAIVLFASGDLGRMREAVALTAIDWRDALVAAGQDRTPSQARETKRRRGQSIAAAQQAIHAYATAHPDETRPDPQDFAEIRDGLANTALRQTMDATGLAKTTASQIRSGGTVPHRRHWPALRQLAMGSETTGT